MPGDRLIAVTGATGAVGTKLIARLAQADVRVRARSSATRDAHLTSPARKCGRHPTISGFRHEQMGPVLGYISRHTRPEGPRDPVAWT